jgi:hypothetical protein
VRDGWEVLVDDDYNSRARRFIKRFGQEAPAGSVTTTKYRGEHKNLMLYGPGAPAMLGVIGKHRAKGGRVAMWDLGYWSRDSAMRLSIDTLHPTAEALAQAPRTSRRTFTLREEAKPDGPILLIGLGPKSNVAYGLKPMQWERNKVRELTERFRGRTILWRPKGKMAFKLLGTTLRHGMPIEEAMRGCSLLVCRHSNAAVDACVAGIPVECEDGAALALYQDNSNPSRDERTDFLRRLSWFEWDVEEVGQAWTWISKVIEGGNHGCMDHR